MLDKRDDDTDGEQQKRMAVNYQALKALTMAPAFP